jgi:hypothetical protein
MDKMNACEASSSKEGEKIAEAEVAGWGVGSSTNDNSPAHYLPITDGFLSFLPRLDEFVLWIRIAFNVDRIRIQGIC